MRRNTFTIGGTLPLNTSGGQLSVGQAGAAGGYLGLVEAMRQLTGQALGAQVENARLGLVSGFGMINYDRGLCGGAAVLGCRMTEPLNRPKPRNPVRALRLPTLPPGARSRAALRLTAAAAEGRLRAADTASIAARCSIRRARHATSACRTGSNGARPTARAS